MDPYLFSAVIELSELGVEITTTTTTTTTTTAAEYLLAEEGIKTKQ